MGVISVREESIYNHERNIGLAGPEITMTYALEDLLIIRECPQESKNYSKGAKHTARPDKIITPAQERRGASSRDISLEDKTRSWFLNNECKLAKWTREHGITYVWKLQLWSSFHNYRFCGIY